MNFKISTSPPMLKKLNPIVFFLRLVLTLTILFVPQLSFAEIKVLYTAALISENYKQRQKDYTQNLKILTKKYGLEVYIVESCHKLESTFLNDYCTNVCYTKSNNPSRSKSFNEVASMRIGLQQFNFDPNDMIIKITGRYVMKTNEFIQFVKTNPKSDIIARIWNDADAYTGYFAIRAKYLTELLDLFLERDDATNCYCIEWALGQYIESMKSKLKILPIPRLYYAPDCCNRW